MAYEIPVQKMTFSAAADLSDYQYHFVKISADNTVAICAADTDVPIGILQNAPSAAGDACEVMTFGVSKLMVGSDITAGELVGTDAAGEGEPKTIGTDTTKYVCAQAIVGADDGEYATVIFSPVPFRAA